MSLIGLCGAHRTGKTTLANRFADVSGYTMLETNVSEIMAVMGADPRAEYPIEQRLLVQRRLLLTLTKIYDANQNFAIADRTPLDLAAYMLADVTRGKLTPASDREVSRYVDDCFLVTRKYFSGVVVIQPGIEVVDQPDKAQATNAYIEHINMLCLGAVATGKLGETRAYTLGRSCTDLEERVECLINIVAEIPYKFNYVAVEQKLPM